MLQRPLSAASGCTQAHSAVLLRLPHNTVAIYGIRSVTQYFCCTGDRRVAGGAATERISARSRSIQLPIELLSPGVASPDPLRARHTAALIAMKLRVRGACPALASTVAFAYCDLAGAGPRALMALEPPAGCSMVATELDVEGLPAVSRAFATQHGRSAPLELVTFADSSGTPKQSLLLLLAPVPEEHQTAVAAAIFDFLKQPAGAHSAPAALASATLTERGGAAGPTSRLVVAAAMRFPASQAGPTVCAVAYNGAAAAGLPSLPPDTTVSDGMLASLLHFCRAGGLPTLALLAPGYRVRLPGSAVDDEAVAVRFHVFAVRSPGVVLTTRVAGGLPPCGERVHGAGLLLFAGRREATRQACGVAQHIRRSQRHVLVKGRHTLYGLAH